MRLKGSGRRNKGGEDGRLRKQTGINVNQMVHEMNNDTDEIIAEAANGPWWTSEDSKSR